MNRITHCVIRSYLTQDIKYYMMTETSAKKIWEIDPRKQVLDKKQRELLAREEDALSFPIKEMYLDR